MLKRKKVKSFLAPTPHSTQAEKPREQGTDFPSRHPTTFALVHISLSMEVFEQGLSWEWPPTGPDDPIGLLRNTSLDI